MDGMSGEIVGHCGYDWWLKLPNDYSLYALPSTCLVLLDTSYHTSCAGCAAAAAGGGAAWREGDAAGKRGHDMHEDGMATPWRTTTSEQAKRFSSREAKGERRPWKSQRAALCTEWPRWTRFRAESCLTTGAYDAFP